jgi:hypothetical protein
VDNEPVGYRGSKSGLSSEKAPSASPDQIVWSFTQKNVPTRERFHVRRSVDFLRLRWVDAELAERIREIERQHPAPYDLLERCASIAAAPIRPDDSLVPDSGRHWVVLDLRTKQLRPPHVSPNGKA